MSWVDIVFIALVVLFGAFGVLSGIKKSAVSLGAFLVAFVLAFFLSNVVAEALLNITGVRLFVVGTDGFSLFTWINSHIGPDSEFVCSDFQTKYFFQPIYDVLVNAGEGSIVYPAMIMAFGLFSAICGVGLFIVIRLLLVIVTVIIRSFIDKKKSALSRLFGFFLGAIRGFLYAFSLTLIFTMMGGLTFASGFATVENEYESSVIGKPVYQVAYTIKNSMLLPNWDTYDRIVKISGININDEDKEGPDTLIGQKLETYCDIMNLNYKSGTPYMYSTGNLVVDDTNCEIINPDDYKLSGFDTVVRAIMEYNAAAGEAIKGESFSVDNVTLSTTYKTTIQMGDNSLYNCMNNLIGTLGNYELKIYTNRNLVDEDLIGTTNKELKVMYDSLVATVETIKSNYAELTAFGTFSVEIPEIVTIKAAQ